MKLTTNHSQSSYGIPVLVDADNNAYGPDDIVSTHGSLGNLTAREYVKTWMYDWDQRSVDDIMLAGIFMGIDVQPAIDAYLNQM